MTMEPFSGLSSPISDFRSADLPVPDGPSSTLTSPGGSVSVTSDQMFARPKDLVSPSTFTPTPGTSPPRALEPPRPAPAGARTRPAAPNDDGAVWLLPGRPRRRGPSDGS